MIAFIPTTYCTKAQNTVEHEEQIATAERRSMVECT